MLSAIFSRTKPGLIAGAVGATTVLGLIGSAQGAVIAEYRFDDQSPASNDSNLQSTATDFSNGANSGFEVEYETSADSDGTADDDDPNVDPNLPAREQDANNTPNDSSSSSDGYYTFTVTPTAGNEIQYESAEFAHGIFDDGGGGLNGDSYLRWSVDNFGSVLASVATSTGDSGRNADGYEFGNADLSGSAVQSGAVEFRLYLQDGSGSGQKVHRVDDVIVEGTASPIPEPASLALLGVGGVLMLGRRQRRV